MCLDNRVAVRYTSSVVKKVGWIAGQPGDEEQLRSLGFVVGDRVEGPEPDGCRAWEVEGDEEALARLNPLWGRFYWALWDKGSKLDTTAIDEYLATGERPWFGDKPE